jgi:hypothetical protein
MTHSTMVYARGGEAGRRRVVPILNIGRWKHFQDVDLYGELRVGGYLASRFLSRVADLNARVVSRRAGVE